MQKTKIVEEISIEIANLERARSFLMADKPAEVMSEGTGGGAPAKTDHSSGKTIRRSNTAKPRKPGKISEAGRARIGAAKKKWWANKRKEEAVAV